MTSTTETVEVSDFLAGVCDLIVPQLRRIAEALEAADLAGTLAPGKMLRSRLGAHLAAAAEPPDLLAARRVCAATELAHTASLCHDDVIDNALLRRGHPSLWRLAGPSGAVLIGDMLLCEATELLLDTEDGRHLRSFSAKLKEVCLAETEQELRWRATRRGRSLRSSPRHAPGRTAAAPRRWRRPATA